MDKELEEMLRFARLFSTKLRIKKPTDRGKDYIIALQCMIDAAVETIEDLEAEDDDEGV